jgi:hypothetical protein
MLNPCRICSKSHRIHAKFSFFHKGNATNSCLTFQNVKPRQCFYLHFSGRFGGPYNSLSVNKFLLFLKLRGRVVVGMQNRSHKIMELNGFSIDEEIGHGAFGTIYRGHSVTTHEPVAIKVEKDTAHLLFTEQLVLKSLQGSTGFARLY